MHTHRECAQAIRERTVISGVSPRRNDDFNESDDDNGSDVMAHMIHLLKSNANPFPKVLLDSAVATNRRISLCFYSAKQTTVHETNAVDDKPLQHYSKRIFVQVVAYGSR